MVAVLLFMLIAGMALSQAASDPRAVTLRWLRLGGLIAAGLHGVAVAVHLWAEGGSSWMGVAGPGVAVWLVAHLMLVQTARRIGQRVVAGALFLAASSAAVTGTRLGPPGALDGPGASGAGGAAGGVAETPVAEWAAIALSVPLSGGLLGGLLMTMLLGHAYLTAGGEMTQAPFRRLVRLLGGLLVVRLLASLGFGLLPWWQGPAAGGIEAMWASVMVASRYGVGIAVPAIFLWMTHDCVRRVANQSATGILYVTSVLVVIGEGIALGLIGSTGQVF